jgi:hypothetical protein
MTIDVESFTRGLIAALVEGSRSSIQPKRPEDRRGFYKIHEYLDEEVRRAREGDDREWMKQIVRLRNRLMPGPTGAFDQFETAFRDLQLSFTESPNVYYEDIEFTISKPFATSTLESMDNRERELVKNAAKAFVSGSAQRQ